MKVRIPTATATATATATNVNQKDLMFMVHVFSFWRNYNIWGDPFLEPEYDTIFDYLDEKFAAQQLEAIYRGLA